MRGCKIILDDTELHTGNDLGLVQEEKVINNPKVQSNLLQVPGRDGLLNLTKSLTGDVRYFNRDILLKYFASGVRSYLLALKDRLNRYHGETIKLIDDDTNNFYYEGEVTVDPTINNNHAFFNLKINASPYRYEINEYTKSLSYGAIAMGNSLTFDNTIEAPLEVEKLYGMSRKCNNLINVTTGSSDNIDKIKIENGEIVYTNSNWVAMRYLIPLKSHTDYTISVNITITSGTAFIGVNTDKEIASKYISTTGKATLTFNTESNTNIYFAFCGTSSTDSGKFSNVMINEGTTALPYETYTDQFIDGKSNKLTSTNKNLYPYGDLSGPGAILGSALNGVPLKLKAGTYTISFIAKKYSGAIQWFFSADEQVVISPTQQNIVFILNNFQNRNSVTINLVNDYNYIYIYSNNLDNEIEDIQLEKSPTATTYIPHKESVATVPQAIKDLPGYGIGISPGLCNYLDFVPKTYHNMKSVDLGTLDWVKVDNYFKADTSQLDIKSNGIRTAILLCAGYDTLHNSQNFDQNWDRKIYNIDTNSIGVIDKRYSNANTFKAAMSNVILHYEATSGGSDYDAELYYRDAGEWNLGDSNWTYDSTNQVFIAPIPNGKTNIGLNVVYNMILANYTVSYSRYGNAYNTMANMEAIWARDSSSIIIKDTRYTDAATFKAAMQGVMLYYELATPEILDITDHADFIKTLKSFEDKTHVFTDNDLAIIDASAQTGEEVILENLQKTVNPTVTVSDKAMLDNGKVKVTLNKGTYQLANMPLRSGDNPVKVGGIGTVKISYRRGEI